MSPSKSSKNHPQSVGRAKQGPAARAKKIATVIKASAKKRRPTRVLNLSLEKDVKAVVRRSHFGKLRISVRENVESDRKASAHGDMYIVKKIFGDNNYERLRGRVLKEMAARKVVGVKTCPAKEVSPFGARARLLDLGANIGAVAVKAAADGAEYVVAVEPDPESFTMVEKNFKKNKQHFGRGVPLIALCGAVVPKSQVGRKTYLYSKEDPEGKRFTALKPNRNTLIPPKGCSGHIQHEVQENYCLPDLLKKHSPNVIKIDIEGHEKNVIPDMKPSHLIPVRELFVYWHLDVYPDLFYLDQFLRQLERLFPIVQIEDHLVFHHHDLVLEKGPSKEINWRRNIKKGHRVIDWKKVANEFGKVAAKKDVLIYCLKDEGKAYYPC